MAKRGNPSFKKGQKPPVGKPWEPGQTGNPAGRPPIPPDVKEARKLTQVEFERATNQILFMTRKDLTALIQSQDSQVLDLLVARILAKGIENAGTAELNYFVERFLGKVADNINVSGNLNSAITDFIAATKALEKE